MTTMTTRDPQDKARLKQLEKRLMSSPELAEILKEFATSSTDINDMVRSMIQTGINTALQAEMDAHLGYQAGDRTGKARHGTADNHRNGSYNKTVQSQYGPIDITVPRDRSGSFTPRMVPKGARRITDVDDLIISLYAAGTSLRDIQHHLATTLGVDLSHETISQITDQVLDEVLAWQHRDLEEFYPVIYLDALRIKIRDGARVVNKACYMAVGITMEGTRQILGLWIANNEGAAFWAQVCAELANRGVKDVFIVCCDGLKGFEQAVQATWPDAMVQTCVVHLIRTALQWVAAKDRSAVAAALKKIYTAATAEQALAFLDEFDASDMGLKYPQAVKAWRDAWERFIPFLQFPPQARKVVYTTNAIESMNAQLRKATRNRGQFPNDAAAVKALWLMICHIEDRQAEKTKKKAGRARAGTSRFVEGVRVTGWVAAINQLSAHYPDRFEPYL
ncbi:IS256 family transposase [Corynebacterium aquilae]|uniref:Mutator family transposase n=1 Tax=Corynebacterium aquilae DSM 44791 TaxID=1431546 RepID=A0A1L7CF73_9CORY|nr:transposase [Corynebacterium aquilae DSM 44791]